ncbi:MAG: hypothetical protein K0U98_27215 [Deltaproteobacteria bacterium]|nr:hypothetical protein [Deltaproteobacteria bacterium]
MLMEMLVNSLRKTGWGVIQMILVFGCGSAWLLAAAPAAAGGIVVSLGEEAEISVPVGSHIYVQWQDAPVGKELTLDLVDELGQIVAKTEAVADIDGILSPELLWEWTGVAGCDPETVADIDGFRFHRFEMAEALLPSHVFEVRAYGTDGEMLESAEVKFESIGTIHYFSDATGCLRTVYGPEETVLVAVYHLPEEIEKMSFFMIPEIQQPPFVGMPLLEVREEYKGEPQVLGVHRGATWSLLEPVDEAFVFSHSFEEQVYGGVLRPDVESASEGLEVTDHLVAPSGWEICFDSDAEIHSATKGLRIRPYRDDDDE